MKKQLTNKKMSIEIIRYKLQAVSFKLETFKINFKAYTFKNNK